MFGLTHAFGLAGARTTIASLWKVDDAATQALMTEFYTNLWKKRLGKLESLRQAQLTMMRDYEPKAGAVRGTTRPLKPVASPEERSKERESRLPPYYWAAFVLNGDWR